MSYTITQWTVGTVADITPVQGCGVLIFLWDSDSDSDSRVLKNWDSDSDSDSGP